MSARPHVNTYHPAVVAILDKYGVDARRESPPLSTQELCDRLRAVDAEQADIDSVRELHSIDPDAQCPEHGCARWHCDESHA